MDFHHTSVLLQECLEGLAIKPDGIYIDGTTGGAGHSREIAKQLTTGRLICLDKDPDALKTAEERLREFSCVTLVKSDFSEMKEVCERLGITQVDGILLDLGVSSHQLDTAQRGFSYHNDAPLDMRMSQEGLSAYDVVNTYQLNDLTRILREYGEEKFSYPIAKQIVRAREEKPIETTLQLVDIIKQALPEKEKRKARNPARKTFQALRIEVNGELEVLNTVLDDAFDLLGRGGRLCIITFHSLEDRMVKQRYVTFATGCTCPPDFPVCVCGKTPRGKIRSKKPITASEEELIHNKRSRSAKLRVVEKL